MNLPGAIAFTDLDGTLLAHEDYDWRPAAPALEALRARGIPLVMASSKTRAEIERWRARLGNRDPFIAENGGALFVPDGWGPAPPGTAKRVDDLWRLEFGTPWPRLRAALPAIARATRLTLTGFGDMRREEVARLTGIDDGDLDACLAREYDEPFLAAGADEDQIALRLAAAAAVHGLAVTRGGRFHHLIGANDKGRAARALCDWLSAGRARPRTVAAGDSANDLELLAAADRAIVVARPGGGHARALRDALPGARFTRAIGPAGFREGVLEVLAEWDAERAADRRRAQ